MPRERPQSARELVNLIASGEGAVAPAGPVVDVVSGTRGRALTIDEMQAWSRAVASARSGQLATRDSSMHGIDPRSHPMPTSSPAPAPARRVAEGREAAPPFSDSAPAGSSRRSIVLALATAVAALVAGAVLWLGRRDPTVVSPGRPDPRPSPPSDQRRNLPLVPPVGATGGGAADTVEMTVFAPPMVKPGEAVLVQLFLHLAPDAERALVAARMMDAVTERRGTRTLDFEIRRGARVDITLACKGVDIDEPMQTLRWRGEPAFAQFVLDAPQGLEGKSLAAVARVSIDGDLIGKISFRLAVGGGGKADLAPTGDQAGRYRYAFVSYASQDRKAVLERVQMLQATRTDFFQDVLRLDPGARWEQELYRNIDKCDLFLLFWSSSARSSECVMKEVEYALELQRANPERIPDIVPVVIEGPPPVLPPASLSALHFDDRIRYFIAAG